MRIVIIERPGAPHLSVLKKLPADVEVVVGTEPEELKDAAAGAEVIVNGYQKGTTLGALLPHAKSLRWIHSLSAGIESLMTDGLAASAVPMTNARGVYKHSLAEFALFGMLFFAKNARRFLSQQAASKWEGFDIEEIRGRVCAILSYGEIGRAVASRAKAMGMTVIATRRRVAAPHDDLAEEIVGADRTDEIMSRGDYVVCCSPLTQETRGMIGEREFAAMKSAGVFINIGRGAVVNEAALIRVLQERKIRGAVLDVFETEPLPQDSPLWKLDNVFISPHCADNTATWRHESVEFFVENFERYRKGEPLENIVDKKAGY